MAEITEEQVFSALGIDPAGETAAAETDAGAVDSSPEQAQEAVPEEQSNGNDVAEAEGEDDTGAQEAAAQPQSTEQRHTNAARRRQAEEERRQQAQQAAIDAEVQKAREEERAKGQKAVQDMLEQAGLVNSYTKTPIRTAEDFEAWHREHESRKLQKAMKEGTMTADQLNQVIEQNPTVKAMKDAQETQQQAARQAAEREQQARINAELAEITKLDPSIKTVHDLTTMPNAKAFYGMVQRGATFLEAYKATNYDTMQKNITESARQQAGMNARGKDHLNATPSARGTGAVTVPRDQMRMFRAFNPNATDAEIQAYYNKTLK